MRWTYHENPMASNGMTRTFKTSSIVLCAVALLVTAPAAAQFITCPPTHTVEAVQDGGGLYHENQSGQLDPPFMPPVKQGDLIEIYTDSQLPPNSSALFITHNGGSSFPEKVGGPLLDLGPNGDGTHRYQTVVPYWLALLPGPTFRIAIQRMGCAPGHSRVILPISDELTFPSGLDWPASIPPPYGIEAAAVSPTSIEVRWQQAGVAAGYNEDNFEVVATPSSSQYPPVKLLLPADTEFTTVTGLAAGTLYEIEVYSLDATGTRVGSNLVPFPRVTTHSFGSAGTITVTDVPGFTNPLCGSGTHFPVTIDAVYDLGVLGKVDAFQGSPMASVDFPYDAVEVTTNPRGYEVFPGDSYHYDVDSNMQANTIIFTPSFFACGSQAGPRFVAVHVFIAGANVTPLEMTAGTLYGIRGEMVGVVASTDEFGGHLDYDPSTGKISGNISGVVAFDEPQGLSPIQYRAMIDLSVNTVAHSDDF